MTTAVRPPEVGSHSRAPGLYGDGPHRVRGVVRAARIRQWVKNALVLVAPAAAGVLRHGAVAARAGGVFAVFCAAASGVYLLNDSMDAIADRGHPDKCHRPVAAGTLPLPTAVAIGMLLLAGALAGSWVLAGWQLALVIGLYAGINVAYILGLKHQAVIELAAVASGFVLRAIAGGVATHVPLSNWFLVVTSFGALFVVTGKRVAEHRLLGDDRVAHRPVLGQYSAEFLYSTLILTASATVTAYCLWAFERTGLADHAGHHLIWIQLSVVPVVIGVLHVLRVLDAGEGGAPEDLVLRDRTVQVLGLVWTLLFALGLYG
ncbi:MAG: decaprenyl-phosphate phosphoribosyltransferase [Actinomycetota bacterium]|nr:decaprenyl-phosphate phosphoribosyltransferase [Actinomycetota bacterium]